MNKLSLSRRELLGAGAGLALAPALPAVPSREAVVTLLFTNDLHGHVWHGNEAQGLTRLGSMVETIRGEMPHVLLLDAGDIIHGTPEERAWGGKPILSAMNALRYDVAAAGNHEFDWGQKNLRAALRYARFPMLAANVRKAGSDKPWGDLEAYKIFVRGGVRIGVFGLTTPTTVAIQWPRTLEGIVFADPYPVAREMVSHLREREKADVVVALSHLGFAPDKEMARLIEGIDIILGGHSHTTLAEQVWENGVLIAQTGAYGKALGRVDVWVREQGGIQELSINGQSGMWWGKHKAALPLAGKTFPATPLLLPSKETPEHKNALRAYKPYRERMNKTLSETLTEAAEPLSGAGITKGETPLGNLLADAVRASAKADIAFIAGSQVGAAGLQAGPVTVGDLYTLLGAYTRQHIVLVDAPRAAIGEALARVDAAEGFPVHVSGLTRALNGAPLIKQELLDTRLYTVAAPAHVMQDYFLGKAGVVVREDSPTAPTLRDAAIAFLRGHAPLQNTTDKRL